MEDERLQRCAAELFAVEAPILAVFAPGTPSASCRVAVKVGT